MRDTSMYAIERKRGEQAVEALTHGFRYELRRPTFPALRLLNDSGTADVVVLRRETPLLFYTNRVVAIYLFSLSCGYNII